MPTRRVAKKGLENLRNEGEGLPSGETSTVRGSVETLKLERPENLDSNLELSLREEIRATQGSQAEVLRWKLLAVAAVGAVALSAEGAWAAIIEGKGSEGISVGLLCLIPMICLYSDLLGFHYMLRIITIGAFVGKSWKEFRLKTVSKLRDYEGFVFEGRKGAAFNLEIWAIIASSLVLDFVFATIGSFGFYTSGSGPHLFLAITAFGGGAATIVLLQSYKGRLGRIHDVSVAASSSESVDANRGQG